MFKEHIRKLIEANGIKPVIQRPPREEMGDFAVPLFEEARRQGKSPAELALYLAERIHPNEIIREVKAEGPYLNIFLNKARLAEEVITHVLNKEQEDKKRGGILAVEFFQANTHKAVHIGHIRNLSIGEALCRIAERAGNRVIRINYQGDIGMHVAKCLWGMKHFNLKMPEEGAAEWLGGVYMKANKFLEAHSEFEEEVAEINIALHKREKEWTELWLKTREACLKDFSKLYEEFDVKFDRLYFESEVEQEGVKQARELERKGIAKRSEGALIVDLSDENMGVVVLLRSDDTPLYHAKDLGLAKIKFREFNPDKSIHIVGKEQELYFRQLFRIFELGKFEAAHKSVHIPYELVMLPEGKMSSREGNVVLYSHLRDRMTSLALKGVKERHPEWPANKSAATAGTIALAALKFSMVKIEPLRIITFSWENALDFEGETGPYVLYTLARCNSIIRKYKDDEESVDYSLIDKEEEKQLLFKVAEKEEIIADSARTFRPHLLARYLIELSQMFNEYYHKERVISSDRGLSRARVLLVKAVRETIRDALTLLNIPLIEEM